MYEVAAREGKLLPLDHSKARREPRYKDQMTSRNVNAVTDTTKI